MLVVEKTKNQLKSDGYVLIKRFFYKTKELKDFKKTLLKFIQFELKNEKITNINKSLSLKFKKNSKISSFLNDNINLSPYLSSLLTSKKLISFLSKILNVEKNQIIFNNQRFRIQIPGNDEIANLTWHQDIAYNKLKNTKSIVAWISLGNISEDMGPIIFKKGSHKLGVQKQIKFKKKNGGKSLRVDINSKDLKNLKDVILETLSGDLILIDMKTVHSSGSNKTKYKLRS